MEQSQNNAYFEGQVKKHISGLSEEDLANRLHQCQTVVSDLAGSPAWKIVITDSKKWVTQLDSVWQDTFDEKQLASMRVLKLAYKHILDLPQKYLDDLKFTGEELETRSNPEENIRKDYDDDTNQEG